MEGWERRMPYGEKSGARADEGEGQSTGLQRRETSLRFSDWLFCRPTQALRAHMHSHFSLSSRSPRLVTLRAVMNSRKSMVPLLSLSKTSKT